MKVGKVVNVNKKGQIVIPQEYRELFGIKADAVVNIVPKATGLFIHPISGLIPTFRTDDIYEKILEETTGAWREDAFDKTTKDRRKIELSASKRRKKEW